MVDPKRPVLQPISRLGSLAALALMAAAACGDPMENNPGDPGSDSLGAASLNIQPPGVLLVHQRALITVTARDSAGNAVALPGPLLLTSSDPRTGLVIDSAVVEAAGRGTFTLVARSGTLTASVSVTVRARATITGPAHIPLDNGYWPMAVGDTLQFTAIYADIDGVPTGETAVATWSSSNPAAVAVDASGRVTGLRPLETATILVQTPDGVDSVLVATSTVVAGAPATVRFAHVAPDLGPITFLPSKGTAFTLSYGEVTEREVGSGTFIIETSGLPHDPAYDWNRHMLLAEGEYVTLFAIGNQAWGRLTRSYGRRGAAVAADSTLVTLVQASMAGPRVVYVRSTGAPMSGLPELCYFDPGDAWSTSTAAGGLDLILQDKYGSMAEIARHAVTGPAGQAVTFVLIGDSPATMNVLVFPDP